MKIANSFRHDLGQKYKLKFLGVPAYMVGMQLAHGDGWITVKQTRYIQDIAKKFGSNLRQANTPATTTVHLTKAGSSNNKDSPLVNCTKYRSLVGALMYTVMTRPDVATAVSICAKFLQAPRHIHWESAVRVLGYLANTPEVGLTYHRTKDHQLSAYVDASWADDKDSRRSRFGYAVYLGTNLLEWKSKLHACITLSTAESEYVAATEACKTIVWLRNTLIEMNIAQDGPTRVFEDNKACILMASNRMITGRNKHMELKQHFVRSMVLCDKVKLEYIGTKLQRADILTKNLAYPDFRRIRDLLLGQTPHQCHCD
jgi:hypothetical protein